MDGLNHQNKRKGSVQNMRKMMNKEITFTTLKLAKLEVKEGKPEIVNLPDEVILGTISTEKAQKLVNKKHKTVVTILSHDITTHIYEMPVEEFVKVAKIAKTKTENTDTDDTDTDDTKTENTDTDDTDTDDTNTEDTDTEELAKAQELATRITGKNRKNQSA